ncbi:hypothetical protein [Mesoplasma melaleucae]|uniref:Uncharacterized protein n=1 Tax=Mesoplasma melaleucae TaxID=81459 RepID=A0A2K8NX22_9MOLU|nr:hypothetical protein [Mesoplasma melaleucae]ATZ18327.1 hypothetical protein EMELA_v1c08430 [Mesoplasma melaleucae]
MFKVTKEIKANKHFLKARTKQINKWLYDHGLTKREAKRLVKFARENIILRIFLNLLDLEGKNKKSYILEIIYITLYSNVMQRSLEIKETKESKIEYLKIIKLIESLMPHSEDNIFEKINYEKIIFNDIKDFSSFNDEILDKRKNFYFTEIGYLFSTISDNNKELFYKYGYLLSMYVVTYFESDMEKKNETFNNFFFKLKLNDTLNETTKEISPFHFNGLIIKINKSLTKYSRTFKFKDGA